LRRGAPAGAGRRADEARHAGGGARTGPRNGREARVGRDLLRPRRRLRRGAAAAPARGCGRPRARPLVTADGAVVGEHEGFARYTVGQRRGLPGGFRAPMYVVAIRPETREVVIGPGDELFGHEVRLETVNWLADPIASGEETFVQCRSRAKAAAACLREAGPGTLVLDLAQPVRALTPGQSGALDRSARPPPG